MPTRAWGSLGCALVGAIVLSGCGTPSATPAANASDPAAVDSGVVQSLQRQIRERDRRIAELTSQLEVLKLIDQDVEERRKPIRPPATLTPLETDQGR
jgi:hypothetical protein